MLGRCQVWLKCMAFSDSNAPSSWQFIQCLVGSSAQAVPVRVWFECGLCGVKVRLLSWLSVGDMGLPVPLDM